MIRSATVVMPAYKATATLRTALQSLLDQAGRPDTFEIIVVDDASPDDTADLAESFIAPAAEHGIDLRVMRLARNGGPARARNAGAVEAGGEVIIFTDSDCELTPEWLSQMLRGFDDPADIPFSILLPAFVTSELETAFQIGFMLFLPFLVIDLVVASVLMSLGMMMLSPTIISLPFKLLLFVLVDGWALLMGSLAMSFG